MSGTPDVIRTHDLQSRSDQVLPRNTGFVRLSRRVAPYPKPFENGANPYAGCAAKAPAVLLPCYRTGGLRFPEFDLIDLSIATENALLEITSLGLGGVWLAIAPLKERVEKADSVLGIGTELHAFALVPFGYPAEDRKQEDRFKPERVHYL